MNDRWNNFFFAERPSVSLSLFRVMLAVGIGVHLLPTILNAPDVYYETAFKVHNFKAYPAWLIYPISHSSDIVVTGMILLFVWSWLSFGLGYKTRVHCVLLLVTCIYLEALNSFYLHALAYDVLIASLFLLCLTPGTGDFFSVDAYRKSGAPSLYSRPVTIQRLLQLQLSWIYFYSGITKISPGNWLSDNPVFYLVHYPPQGVIRDFWMRDYLAGSPEVCLLLGYLTVGLEVSIAVLLWIPKWRPAAILAGILFHLILFGAIHIQTLFIIIFPASLFLFIPPESVLSFLKSLRRGTARDHVSFHGNHSIHK